MINNVSLVNYLNTYLKSEAIKDYCPNGLQIEGKSSIKKIVTAVSACEESIDKAIAQNADALLVHHGFFWKNETPEIIGAKKKRIAKLLANDINLFAYHLPLDIHPVVGNNACLAEELNINITETVSINGTPDILWLGELNSELSLQEFESIITKKLNRKPLIVPAENKSIKKLAWCTGAAADFFELAIKYEIDAYITGEISERNVYLPAETNVNLIAAGHYATEQFGVQALGKHLASKFNLDVEFVELKNGNLI